MLERFRQFWTNVWAPLADLLLRLGVKPDHVTIVSTLGVCAGALWFFPRGQFFVGVMVVTAFVFGDIMDGYMARKTGQSSAWGAFLDSTLDRFGDAAIFGGLVLYYAQADAETDLGGPTLYLCLSLACLVLGNITSYARARAESLGMKAKGGIAERADRLVAILVMTGFNGLLGLPFLTEITLWALTAASFVTIAQRMVMVHRQAVGKPAPPQAGRPPGNE